MPGLAIAIIRCRDIKKWLFAALPKLEFGKSSKLTYF